MNQEVERYLRAATRGLWGRRRAQVRAELRGGVENKLWRYQLLGHGPEEATARALRAALSLTALNRSAAQVVAASCTPQVLKCDFSPQGIAKLNAALKKDGFGVDLGQSLKGLEPQKLEDACHSALPNVYQFLDYDNLLEVLRHKGVTVSATKPSETCPRQIFKPWIPSRPCTGPSRRAPSRS